ncbi:glycoside hydrolase [Paenibacillus selenitireducens]|uniref:Glycoside hydrolase n=1 Tax=Paenibacillus selenitireducens TaxID=1324314 RepID=A0A1T2XL21_9BACL|nr:glycoside hydrolase family 43 protein [Paenibacillus selenitireducens]OPA80505.1 glycoside hydrolase [Paenibacillus selenitireducens]
MKRLSDINLRDPYILPVSRENTYYLYGTDGATAWHGKPAGFDVYKSCDLLNWEGPYPAFRPGPTFWGTHHYWAPEVHFYQGKFYMFASFKAEGIARATHILVADHPLGPFQTHGDSPITPRHWECLDGTLYIEKDGTPWMVFCREWLQVTDGEMYAVQLAPNLYDTVGEPILLFKASSAPWSKPGEGGEQVTDGPYLHRMGNGQLVMLWSSGGYQGYATGLARSVSGKIIGPWKQDETPIFHEDGGHGMLFQDWYGNLLLTLHAPNNNPKERPIILRVEERSGTLEMKEVSSAF